MYEQQDENLQGILMISYIQQVSRVFDRSSPHTSRIFCYNAMNLWVVNCVAIIDLMRGVIGIHLGPEAFLPQVNLSSLSFPKTLLSHARHYHRGHNDTRHQAMVSEACVISNFIASQELLTA